MSASAIIDIKNINKSYTKGIFRPKTEKVLNDIAFSIPPNEVFGIIGPNGAGKSTLLKILMGFIKQDSGEAFIDGIEVSDSSCHKFVGFLPEHPVLYSHLSPYEHLSFACHIIDAHNKKIIKEEILHVLDVVNLSHVINTPVKRFSKGMQQRTALAYSLLFKPKILILDEPMSGLDPIGRHLVIDIMRNFNSTGSTIIFCSHILSDVERICDRIGVMNKGQLLSIIEPEYLNGVSDKTSKTRTPLEDYFLSQILPAV